MRLSQARLIAIGENIQLIALLVDADTPHAKELAVIVASRIIGLTEMINDPEEPTEACAEEWIELARDLVDGGKPPSTPQ